MVSVAMKDKAKKNKPTKIMGTPKKNTRANSRVSIRPNLQREQHNKHRAGTMSRIVNC